MAKQRLLKNPPIVEAVFDIRVKLPGEAGIERFQPIADTLKDDYPQKREKRGLEGRIQVKIEKELTSASDVRDTGFYGIWLSSQDSISIAQFRVDGFTFSRLSPYNGWIAFYSEAMRLWNVYREYLRPEIPLRVALRYINRFEIPRGSILNDYLESSPGLHEREQAQCLSFFSRVVIRDEESMANVNIIQAMEDSVNPEKAVIILDLDLYRTELLAVDDALLTETFEKLRNAKNRIFFSSITEKAAGLFS